MNSEFNDMERMFQEGLQNFEETPPAHVWSNIQKKKRKGLFFYRWKIASAILLLSMAVVSAYYFTTNMDETITSVNTPASDNNTIIEGNLKNRNTENPVISESVTSNKNLNISNSTSRIEVLKAKKNNLSNSVKTKQEVEITEDVISHENSNYDIENLPFIMASKHVVKLRYLIYPSLMQYVYTTKRLGKKHIAKNKDKDEVGLGYKYSIEMVGGPSFAFRSLSGLGSELRNESEKANLSLQTGLKVNYHVNPRWSVQSGLTWENRNEKVNYNRSEIHDKLTQTTRQVNVFHPVLPPQIIKVIDSTYSKETVNYKFNTTNHYSTFNIPVVLGYTFGLGKFQYRVSAGSLLNIASKNIATVLVREGNDINLVKYQESAKIKTSIYSAIALQYPLNPNCIAITEISYYTNISNRLNNDAIVRQRNFGINLSVGARYNLTK